MEKAKAAGIPVVCLHSARKAALQCSVSMKWYTGVKSVSIRRSYCSNPAGQTGTAANVQGLLVRD